MVAWVKRIFGWVFAVIITTILASFFSSQRVLSLLPDPNDQIGFGERISTAIYDVTYFGSLYGLFILIALLIAFLAGGCVFRFAKFGRPIVYMVAGAVAMLVMLLAMKRAFFGVDIVAGARDGFGLFLQMLAGAIGGYVFHRISRQKINLPE